MTGFGSSGQGLKLPRPAATTPRCGRPDARQPCASVKACGPGLRRDVRLTEAARAEIGPEDEDGKRRRKALDHDQRADAVDLYRSGKHTVKQIPGLTGISQAAPARLAMKHWGRYTHTDRSRRRM